MKNLTFYTFIAVLTLFVGSFSYAQAPAKYQAVYNELEGILTSFNNKLDSMMEQERSCTDFAVELVAANGNRGTFLLEQNTKAGIIYNLEAMDELGVKAVKISIPYPILVEGFPNQEAYLDFYKFVFEETRKRNLKILTQLSPAFLETFGSGLNMAPYYEELTRARYDQEKIQMAQLVIDSLAPDYLSLDSEPGTAQNNTGLDFSTDTYVSGVKYQLQNINRKDVKVGAGAGSWDELEIFEKFSGETSLDYIDIHIYPVNFDFLDDKLFKIYDEARANGKPVLIGEAWLYKATKEEMIERLSYMDIYGRDVYKFWDPLDSLFFEAMAQYSVYTDSQFTSLFWMQYLFAKLEYTPQLDALEAQERYAACTQAASTEIVNQNPNNLGLYYKSLINKYYCTTGVDKGVKKDIRLNLYPNPANDYIYIESIKDYRHLVGDIRIYNTYGECVISAAPIFSDIQDGNIRINVSVLPTGIYYVIINSEQLIFCIVR